ncbi:Gfo/Idh/MocA family oxidoreductase [Stieleria sp. TO1_6]|uniref:Gfo/Idh/MocA family protein n=1 Tax=Stieleria tagensis TaxID=2956795 RepID=UPI00209AB0C3|nr:Gfo/Idh/MocA family oxidoreductase [Stieleria tagensis]MCO8124478.1 Gfo/Idh/MocA family oxidoreductase [Stieleria tagensis]
MNPIDNSQRDRRLFLQSGAAALAAYGLAQSSSADETDAAVAPSATAPSEKLTIGIMGTGGRGGAIIKGMLASGRVDIAYACDVDQRASARAAKSIADQQSLETKTVTDFRRILDDPAVDALVCAAPNHWHAPATILGCAAGKHVYVEKPCSHTAAEGEMAVAAARKHDRIVQMGNQRRSWPGLVEAIGKVHAGEIGDVHYARTWYNNRRASIGFGKQVDSPAEFDWDLWQGPVTRRPFKDNLVPYNWHWHWHWGNGELGNNGIHGIDVARWGLQVDFPTRVTAGGGKYRHEDDQETPDTMMVTYDFPDKKTITWEGLSWSPLGPYEDGFGISIHGTDGTIVIRGPGYTQYDMKRKQVATGTGAGGDQDHFANFIDCIREHRRPNSDIEGGHRSTLLCHLGNIAYRTSSVLNTDPANGHIIENDAATALWSQDYANGWEPVI